MVIKTLNDHESFSDLWFYWFSVARRLHHYAASWSHIQYSCLRGGVIYENIKVLESTIEVYGNMQVIKRHY